MQNQNLVDIQKAQNTKTDFELKKQMAYDKKSRETIQKTLEFSGLKLGTEIDYRAVKIYEIDHIHEIYSNNQQSNLPHIVLLHGFGGTSMTFVRFFKNLKDHYKIHALDSLGVGHSSKGVFKNNFTYEQARNYFVDAIEQWRSQMQIQSFTLVGHSFGGYLAACYTHTYPDRVHRLIMLSPAGATESTPEEVKQQLKKRYQKDGIRGKFMGYFAETVYNLKIKPSQAMASWIIGTRLIDRIIDVRFKLKNEQRNAWKSYFQDLSKRQAVSEAGFYIIFEWPLKTKHTIESIVNDLNFNKPIQFYYGEHDWMDSKGAIKLRDKFEYVKFDIISGADHQLIFDNPDEVCSFIMLRRTTEELLGQYMKRHDETQKINIRQTKMSDFEQPDQCTQIKEQNKEQKQEEQKQIQQNEP